MFQTFVTFGQSHIHRVADKIFDKDCIAVVAHQNKEDGRAKVFELFGDKFCFEYSMEEWERRLEQDKNLMTFFPRGYLYIWED